LLAAAALLIAEPIAADAHLWSKSVNWRGLNIPRSAHLWCRL